MVRSFATFSCLAISWPRRVGSSLGVLAFMLVSTLVAQEITLEDYQKLRINEILSQNQSTSPQNCRCRHVDMIELYNGSDKTLPLDGPFGAVRLTDRSTLSFCIDPANPDGCQVITNSLSFRGSFVRRIFPGQRLVIFCDGPLDCLDIGPDDSRCERDPDEIDGTTEVHANFRLSGGGECLVLEVKKTGEDAVTLHEVTFPGLRDDVSYARFPEDVDNVDNFVFSSPPTFGQCFASGQGGSDGPFCVGDPNTAGVTLAPGVERIDFSTNSPASDEDVDFRVRVTDDFAPTAENLASVELRYRVDGGDEVVVPMTFLDLVDESGVPPVPVNDLPTCPSVDRWSLWEATIPGQAAGSVVHFSFHVTDTDGLEGSDPGGPFCDFGVGPCDEFDPLGPGPNCPENVECSAPFRYTVGSDSPLPLVINEVVPVNDSILEDATDPRCAIDNVNCALDDFIEICNSSADQTVDLSGLILTDSPFRPETAWRFRSGSKMLAPGERLIVWIDGDDDDPELPGDPPNPNDPAAGEHHTDFGLNGNRDEIYLLSPAEADYGVIDGVRWGRSGRYTGSSFQPLPFDARDGLPNAVLSDESLSRIPGCDRSSPIQVAVSTPGLPNVADDEELFRRGDANVSSVADITDSLYILEFMFLGVDPAPSCMDSLDVDDNGAVDITDPLRLLEHLFLGVPVPEPGAATCGEDLTEDTFPECVYDRCAG